MHVDFEMQELGEAMEKKKQFYCCIIIPLLTIEGKNRSEYKISFEEVNHTS